MRRSATNSFFSVLSTSTLSGRRDCSRPLHLPLLVPKGNQKQRFVPVPGARRSHPERWFQPIQKGDEAPETEFSPSMLAAAGPLRVPWTIEQSGWDIRRRAPAVSDRTWPTQTRGTPRVCRPTHRSLFRFYRTESATESLIGLGPQWAVDPKCLFSPKLYLSQGATDKFSNCQEKSSNGTRQL